MNNKIVTSVLIIISLLIFWGQSIAQKSNDTIQTNFSFNFSARDFDVKLNVDKLKMNPNDSQSLAVSVYNKSKDTICIFNSITLKSIKGLNENELLLEFGGLFESGIE